MQTVLIAGAGPAGLTLAGELARYAAEPERGAALAARIPDLVEARVRRVPEELGIAVVRPDGSVGFAGDRDAWDAAGAYMARWRAGDPGWPAWTRCNPPTP